MAATNSVLAAATPGIQTRLRVTLKNSASAFDRWWRTRGHVRLLYYINLARAGVLRAALLCLKKRQTITNANRKCHDHY